MNDLWDRCRSALRERMRPEEWHECIGPLRAWMDSGTLYLWVAREADDWRSIPNPARPFDALVRESVVGIWGRAPRGIRYLDRPPNRERIINERRFREHREKLGRQEADKNRKILQYAKEECRKLYREVGDRQIRGTEAEVRRRLEDIAIGRAKLRYDREQRGEGPVRHGEPPKEPPLHRNSSS